MDRRTVLKAAAVDGFRVYDRALSASEIAQLHSTGQ